MKQEKGIALLNLQVEKINDPNISREEWIATTSSVLIRVFPLSSAQKIAQIEKLENNPEYYRDISANSRIEKRKLKAKNYLENYKEEIELLGNENQKNTLEIILKSFRFWCILLSISLISYYGGRSSAIESSTHMESLKSEKMYDLQRQILDLKQENSQLKKDNEELEFFNYHQTQQGRY